MSNNLCNQISKSLESRSYFFFYFYFKLARECKQYSCLTTGVSGGAGSHKKILHHPKSPEECNH